MDDLDALLVRLRTRVPTSQDSAAAADAIETLLKAAPPVVVGEYDGLIARLRVYAHEGAYATPSSLVYEAAAALAAMQAKLAAAENAMRLRRDKINAAQARIAALEEALADVRALVMQMQPRLSITATIDAALKGGENVRY